MRHQFCNIFVMNPWSRVLSIAAATIPIAVAPSSVPAGATQAAGTVYELQVTGRAGVPNGATAASINLTAVNATNAGHLTAYDCGTRPNASTLNYTPGTTVANSTIIPLSANGTVCIHTHATTDILADITGWYPANTDYTPRTPHRLLDTRNTNTPSAGRTLELQITGRAGVPNGATAASINLTAVNATNAGHLTAYDCGTRPNASTLNYTPGTTVANSTIIPLSANGTVCIHTHATTDILADITGWYPANTDYTPRTPHRLLDTRNTNTPSAGRTLELQITGRAGVPNGATAASINLTAVNATNAGHLTAYDCGTRPNASTLNYTPGTTVANSTIIPLSANGTVCIHTHATTDILADITGWYPANTDYTPRTPHRLLDTRNTNSTGGGGNGGGGTGSGTATFFEDFSGNTGLERFDRHVFHRNVDIHNYAGASGGSWTGDHDTACGSPDTQRSLAWRNSDSQSTRQANALYACRDHLMTAMGDVDGFSMVTFAPKPTFDDITRVCIDVNLTDLGARQWWKIGVLSTSLYDSTYRGVPGYLLSDVAASDVADIVGSDRLIASWGGVGAHPAKLRIGHDVGPTANPSPDDKATRHQACLTDNRNGTVSFTVAGTSMTSRGSFPPGPKRVVFYDQNYTPDKDGPVQGHTWHWDNVIVD